MYNTKDVMFQVDIVNSYAREMANELSDKIGDINYKFESEDEYDVYQTLVFYLACGCGCCNHYPGILATDPMIEEKLIKIKTLTEMVIALDIGYANTDMIYLNDFNENWFEDDHSITLKLIKQEVENRFDPVLEAKRTKLKNQIRLREYNIKEFKIKRQKVYDFPRLVMELDITISELEFGLQVLKNELRMIS